MIRINAHARNAWLAVVIALAAPFSAAHTDEGGNADLKTEVARVRLVGPTAVLLRDQAKLKLPEGTMFVPQPTANKILKAMGNHADDRVIGLIYPLRDDQNWAMVAEYEPSGYIKDDDARDWNADELLKSLKEGTAAANEERQKAGFAALEVTGWAEKPAYEANSHWLVWAATAVHPGATGEPEVVNYNTYALGREGYISINLLTDSKALAADKVHARDMLSRLEFVEGKRYADFDSKTDHVAEYGLAAMVAGGLAAKKLGLLAVIGVALLKFWKLGLIALAGIGSGLPWLRKRFGKPDNAKPDA